MAEIINLEDRKSCKGCVFLDARNNMCTNKDFKENMYHVCCELKYCPYKKKGKDK